MILLTATLSPAAGGLATSVPGLVWELVRQGADVHVVGLEDPVAPKAAQSWGPVVHVRPSHPLLAFRYASDLEATLARLAPRLIDVQGLWTYPSLANFRYHRRAGTPYVITPRGMLDPWARERSAWKKRLARLWFEDDHLRRAHCLRATAEMEAEHFRSFGLRNPIAIVPNGIDVPETLIPRPTNDRRRLLFLSRVHPKKGLPHLLRAWAAIEAHRPDWDLVIAGPDELGHTAEMQAMAKRLGIKRMEWRDAVHGDDKSILYRSADLFVLPTHAENFGLVLAEALAHEVPVITTRNAPWEGLRSHGCGWWIDLVEECLRDTLLEATNQPRAALWQMGMRGRAWMQRDFSWGYVAEQMNEVYTWVVSGGPPPTSIMFF